MSTSEVDLLLASLNRDAHDWRIRLLLQRGRSFEASPLPAGIEVMEAGSCYLNAYTLASFQPERFSYYEGYGSLVGNNGWATAHGWCIDSDGRVVDPTWWGLGQPPAAYQGIEIPLDLARPHAYVRSTGTFDWWLYNRREVMEVEMPRLLGVEPLRD
jgi:hypothetical protein